MTPLAGKPQSAEVRTLVGCHFIAASLSTRQCELFLTEGTMQIFVPTRDNPEAKMDLGDIDYTKAELVARQMGLEPKWSV